MLGIGVLSAKNGGPAAAYASPRWAEVEFAARASLYSRSGAIGRAAPRGGKLSRMPAKALCFNEQWQRLQKSSCPPRRNAGVASVELRGLTKRFGDAAVVDNVSLTVEHGRLVCLLGPSGCGKTTTLRLIAGFVEPSAGEIRVGGELVSTPARTLPPERRNMSMIFQSYALWRQRSRRGGNELVAHSDLAG